MIYLIKIWIVNAIWILGNMGNLQIRETFFVAFIGADYNWWLRNYIKITQFSIFVRGRKGWCKVLNVFRMKWGCKNGTSANKGGEGKSKFWSFYDNVIIDCPFLFNHSQKQLSKGVLWKNNWYEGSPCFPKYKWC